MSALSKLGDEIWADVRERWEGDPREGYAWVAADMCLPITRVAVRKKAMKDGWRKNAEALEARAQAKAEAKRALLKQRSSSPSRCRCCENHQPPKNSSGSNSSVLDIANKQNLLHAIALIEEGLSILRKTMS